MPFGRFLRMGFITMLPSTVVCLAVLWLETALF
jgi:Na+/H+ antiporter NhaD/arsenite permease-like protein